MALSHAPLPHDEIGHLMCTEATRPSAQGLKSLNTGARELGLCLSGFSACLVHMERCVFFLVPHKPGMVAHIVLALGRWRQKDQKFKSWRYRLIVKSPRP